VRELLDVQVIIPSLPPHGLPARLLKGLRQVLLSADEFWDGMSVRYALLPHDSPSHCPNCHTPFTLQHMLDCKKGGLISTRHNETRDAWGDLCSLAFSQTTADPVVRPHTSQSTGLFGDLGVRGMFSPQKVCIFDIRVVDTDAASYLNTPVSEVLAHHETQKSTKYFDACKEQGFGFCPLVSSVDGALAPQAEAALTHLIFRLSAKWNDTTGATGSWVRARLSFATIRAVSNCIRGPRIKWRSAVSTAFHPSTVVDAVGARSTLYVS
jgi:hypothetical protein